ncbi:MAG: SPFH domain-containing protein, partial [Nannocystaceae bacterium]
VSIPYRIKVNEAWRITEAGNQIRDGAGVFRFERFADRAATDVLNSTLSKLSSEDFYDTSRRLEVAAEALAVLNEKLSEYHLEADAILIRRANFRSEYEVQLRQIQLNEQNKLLDNAKSAVANEQQRLDTYEQQTQALVAASEQDWARKIAELDRGYQVGTLEISEFGPGAARKALEQLTEADRAQLVTATSKVLGRVPEDISNAHLLGIKNIQAETKEYFDRTQAEAEGIKSRLLAEADAEVAKVQAAFESQLNGLLNSKAGRAFVAYEAAANVKFDETLTFQSDDGIPSVLRLRDFAVQFMGK